MKVGDRVRHKYEGYPGTITKIWDGKYTVPYYEGEQFNPYRITVEFDHLPDTPIEFYTKNVKAEHLEDVR